MIKKKNFVAVKTSPGFRNWAKVESAKRGMTIKNFLDNLAQEGSSCEKQSKKDFSKSSKGGFKIGF